MKYKKGFTLMELLVTVGIIGILSAISLFALADSRKSARDGKRKADLETIRSALELYRADCGNYPPSPLPAPGGSITSSCPGTTVTYLQKIPGDPANNASYPYRLFSNTYTLCTRLEDVPSTIDNSNCGSCTGGTCHYKVVNP